MKLSAKYLIFLIFFLLLLVFIGIILFRHHSLTTKKIENAEEGLITASTRLQNKEITDQQSEENKNYHQSVTGRLLSKQDESTLILQSQGTQYNVIIDDRTEVWQLPLISKDNRTQPPINKKPLSYLKIGRVITVVGEDNLIENTIKASRILMYE